MNTDLMTYFEITACQSCLFVLFPTAGEINDDNTTDRIEKLFTGKTIQMDWLSQRKTTRKHTISLERPLFWVRLSHRLTCRHTDAIVVIRVFTHFNACVLNVVHVMAGYAVYLSSDTYGFIFLDDALRHWRQQKFSYTSFSAIYIFPISLASIPRGEVVISLRMSSVPWLWICLDDDSMSLVLHRFMRWRHHLPTAPSCALRVSMSIVPPVVSWATFRWFGRRRKWGRWRGWRSLKIRPFEVAARRLHDLPTFKPWIR